MAYKSTELQNLTKYCSTTFDLMEGTYVIYFKTVPLFRTIYKELPKTFTLKLMKETDDDYEQVYLMARTPVMYDPEDFDLSVYGMWQNEIEAQKWLDNPMPLY